MPKRHGTRTICYKRGFRRYNQTFHDPLYLKDADGGAVLLSAGVFIYPKDSLDYVAICHGDAKTKPPKGEAEFLDLQVLPGFANYDAPTDDQLDTSMSIVLTDRDLLNVMRQTARRESLEETGIDLANAQLDYVGRANTRCGNRTRIYYMFECRVDEPFQRLVERFQPNGEASGLELRTATNDTQSRFDFILCK